MNGKLKICLNYYKFNEGTFSFFIQALYVFVNVLYKYFKRLMLFNLENLFTDLREHCGNSNDRIYVNVSAEIIRFYFNKRLKWLLKVTQE